MSNGRADVLRFTVEGIPQQAGSTKRIPLVDRDGNPLRDERGNQRSIIKDGNAKLPEYKAAVRAAFGAAYPAAVPVEGPVGIAAEFIFPRPKGHFGTGRNAGVLKPSAPFWKTSKPDEDKLMRALRDALTYLAYRDDAQICWAFGQKVYGARPCVVVRLLALDEWGERVLPAAATVEIGRTLFDMLD